jgi:hypothetical protein
MSIFDACTAFFAFILEQHRNDPLTGSLLKRAYLSFDIHLKRHASFAAMRTTRLSAQCANLRRLELDRACRFLLQNR